jgi:hypothetical protein
MKTIDYLKSLGNEPRLHGNAFIQLDILDSPRTRLHVWHPALKSIAQKVRTPIHDHMFDLKSIVLRGKLRHVVYEAVAVKKGTHHVYRAVPRDKEDTLLVKDQGEVNLIKKESYLLPKGAEYFFGAHQLHDGDADEITVTLMTKLAHYNNHPRVLCTADTVPDNEFNRYQIDTELLWQYIEEAVEEVSLGDLKREIEKRQAA